MATLRDSFNTGDDAITNLGGVYWQGETFIATGNYSVTSVKVKIYRTGTVGTGTLSIRATSSNLPTGADLCSGTLDGSTVTTDTAGAWYEITFGTPANLSSGTKYALVLRFPDADGETTIVSWRADRSSPAYAGGGWVKSTDSGVNWGSYSTDDVCLHEVWGNDWTPPTYQPRPTSLGTPFIV